MRSISSSMRQSSGAFTGTRMLVRSQVKLSPGSIRATEVLLVRPKMPSPRACLNGAVARTLPSESVNLKRMSGEAYLPELVAVRSSTVTAESLMMENCSWPSLPLTSSPFRIVAESRPLTTSMLWERRRLIFSPAFGSSKGLSAGFLRMQGHRNPG